LVSMPSLLSLIVISTPSISNMWPQSCNWLTSSLRYKLKSSIDYTCSNSMLQIHCLHLEFERGCRDPSTVGPYVPYESLYIDMSTNWIITFWNPQATSYKFYLPV
jgi:hypothetical protein